MKTTSILRQNIRSSEFGTDYENYINCLNIGFGQFDFIVMDGATQKMLVYESYELDNVTNDAELVTVLNNIYHKHDCLRVGFWKKIIVNISTHKHTFIPDQYYTSENATVFLKLNTSLNPHRETTESIWIKEQHVVSAFGCSSILKNWLSDNYSQNLVLTHDIASFIKGLIKLPIRLISNQLYVLLKKDFLYVATFEDGKIRFANAFSCQTVTDFIYYIVLVSKELGINRSEACLHFYGQIDDRSVFYQEAKTYFSEVILGKLPSQIQGIEGMPVDSLRAYFELVGAYFLGK